MIPEISGTNESVLVIGEAGCGKRHAAEAIHRKSLRKDRVFEVLDCAAAGDTLDDAAIFGESGKAHPESSHRAGILEKASGGTLYLENLQDLKAGYQSRLLNVIRIMEHPPEQTQRAPHDIRFISSTYDERIGMNGRVRPDLLYSLNTFILYIPPLRKRRQDIPALFSHFLEEECEILGRKVPSVPMNLFESLMEYDWPGNVTELRNTVKTLAVTSPDGRLSAECLPFVIHGHPLEPLDGKTLTEAVSEVEKYLITQSLKRYAGNQTKSARALNVSEAALRYKMKKYGMIRKMF